MQALTWNAERQTSVEGVHSTTLHGKWIHALDSNNEWHGIDTEFKNEGSIFTIGNAPFRVRIPEFADETAEFINENKWDVFARDVITEDPISQEIKPIGAAHVAGHIEQGDLGHGMATYVVYPDAYPFGDLIYYIHFGKAPRLQKLVRFNKAPSNDITIDFDIRFSEDVSIFTIDKTVARVEEMAVILEAAKEERDVQQNLLVLEAHKALQKEWSQASKITRKTGFAHYVSENRGVGFKEFRIWDSGNGLKQKIDLIDVDYGVPKIGGWRRLTKNIPLSFFTDAVFPVFTDTTSTFRPDPDTEISSFDGYTYHGGCGLIATHVGANGTGSGDSSATLYTGLETYCSSPQFSVIFRPIIGVDGSAIADTDVISAITLTLTKDANSLDGLGAAGHANCCLIAVASTPGSTTAIANADFQTAGNTEFGRSGVQSAYANGDPIVITLDANGRAQFSKTAMSGYALRSGWDLGNTATGITWSGNKEQYFAVASADTSGTASDPLFTVTHAPASSGLVGNERTMPRGAGRGILRP